MKIKFFTNSLLFATVILISSCSSKSSVIPAATSSMFTATLNGASETPANASPATGTASFTYNPNTHFLSGTVTFTGIATATTVAHIHKGAVGVAGSPVFTLEAAGPFASPIDYTSPALTSAQFGDLAGGLYYVNIHSTAFPDGEIRGQLILQGTNGGYGGGTGGGGGGGGGY